MSLTPWTEWTVECHTAKTDFRSNSFDSSRIVDPAKGATA